MSEIRKMDAYIRKLLTCERMHQPKADVEQLCPKKRRREKSYASGNSM